MPIEPISNPDQKQPRSVATPRNIQNAIKLYVLLLAAVFLVEWGSAAVHHFILHSGYPTTTPLFDPAARFSDWTNFLPRVAHFGEPDMQTRLDLGLPYPYPLPTIYLFLLFIHLFSDPTLALVRSTLLIFVASMLSFSGYVASLRVSRVAVVSIWATLLLGSPALFLLDRGNIEVFLWLFVLVGLVSFLHQWKYLAAIFFALAACMKIYPALYFLLFLPRRQYKALALGIVATGAFSLCALAGVGPTIVQALHGMAPSAQYLRNTQINAVAEGDLRFDHSLLALEKQAIYTVLKGLHRVDAAHLPTFERSVAVYSILAPLAFVALYLLRLRHMPLLNQFMALTVCSVLLPYVSYDYTLVHVYFVFAVFLLFLLQDAVPGHVSIDRLSLTTILLCLAIVFAPLAFLALEHFPGQIKAIALLGLLTAIVRTPLPSTLFADRDLLRPVQNSNPSTPLLNTSSLL